MPHLEDADAKRLLQFSAAVLRQAFALAAAYRRPRAAAYADLVGAHLRHVIEHYEALLLPKEPLVVDYDSRPRDRELQRNPRVALRRLASLLRRLDDWDEASLDVPVQIRGQAGLAGDFGFAAGSSIGRELVFVTSHAIHHYALLRPHCARHGVAVGADFGRAPSTVAHQNAALAERLAA